MVNIQRINELSRKSREQKLTEEELEEQRILRRAYIDSVVGNLRLELDNTYIVDEKGNKKKVEIKKK